MRRYALAVAVAALAFGLAGCGSASSKSGSHASTHPAKHPPAVGVSATNKASVTTPIHATFIGANHDPKIVVNWPYSVTATDAQGHPLTGTVLIEFTFGGVVVGHDPSGIHHLRNGRWHDTLNFPAASIGKPLAVQAVVHTRLGTATLDWSVTPKR